MSTLKNTNQRLIKNLKFAEISLNNVRRINLIKLCHLMTTEAIFANYHEFNGNVNNIESTWKFILPILS